MNDLLIYLGNSSIVLILFYLVYVLLLKTDTHFQMQRRYLLLAIITVLILPALSFFEMEIPTQNQSLTEILALLQSSLADNIETTPADTTARTSQIWGIDSIISFIYFLGLAIAMFRLIAMGVQLWRISRSADVTHRDGQRLAFSSHISSPFSFFRTIFLPKSAQGEELDASILTHESLHIQHRHSTDLVLAELFVCLMWFHPCSWLLKRALRDSHEYQVDTGILSLGFDRKQYQRLLLAHSLGSQRFTIVHSFYSPTLKHRIRMMNKQQSSQGSLLKYAAIIPVLLLSMSMLAVQSSTPLSLAPQSSELNGGWKVIGKVLNAADKSPIIGATILLQHTRTGSLTDENGEFELELTSAPPSVLEFNFIGMAGYKAEVNSSGILTVYLSEDANQQSHSFQEMKILDERENVKFSVNGLVEKIGEEGQKPLFVIDGIIVEAGSAESDMQAEEIESINVLKGEAARKKYGDKGKNGVIEISRKK